LLLAIHNGSGAYMDTQYNKSNTHACSSTIIIVAIVIVSFS